MLDHLVYAVLDLDEAIADLERRVGVRPEYGGKHVGGLTHNALLSLGEGHYLEVIASVPGTEPPPGGSLPFGLHALTQSGLATWAVTVDDLEATVEAARVAGYDPGKVMAGGRDHPDGGRLQWRLVVRTEPAGDGIVPFLIRWLSQPHPSVTAPKGSRFVSLRAEHPRPQTVIPMLDALGVELSVTVGQSPRLIATLDTPNGRLELC